MRTKDWKWVFLKPVRSHNKFLTKSNNSRDRTKVCVKIPWNFLKNYRDFDGISLLTLSLFILLSFLIFWCIKPMIFLYWIDVGVDLCIIFSKLRIECKSSNAHSAKIYILNKTLLACSLCADIPSAITVSKHSFAKSSWDIARNAPKIILPSM